MTDREPSPPPAPRGDVEPPATSEREPVSAAFETLWENAEAHWEDEKAHAAVLELASRSGLMPELGGRYRKIRENDPARADFAKKRIDALFVVALAKLQETKLPRVDASGRRGINLVGMVLCLALLGLLFWGLSRR